jgi:serine/threonine-protein kinase
VKFILCHDDASLPGLRARFKKEAQAIASLDGHPNVVQIFDYGMDGDVPYLAMELLQGETLRDRLRREKRLTIQATRKILGDIVAGVSRAHKLRIVHRDLKPANIFLAHNDESETAKILDFGIAKILSESVSSATSRALGTINYMSPEQIRNVKHEIDERADLWALGIILFECLTGESPHEANNNVGIMSSLLLGEGPQWNASSRTPDLPRTLDEFFRRSFSPDMRERFQSASELLSAFDDGVRPEPEVSSSARTIQLVHHMDAIQHASGLDAPPIRDVPDIDTRICSDVNTTIPIPKPAVPDTRSDGASNLSSWTPQLSAGATLRLDSPEHLADAQADQAIPGNGLAREVVPATELPLRGPALRAKIAMLAASVQSSLASLEARWRDPAARVRAIALGLVSLAVLTGLMALLFIAFGVFPDKPLKTVEIADAARPAPGEPAATASLPSSIPSVAASPSSIAAEPSPSPSAAPSSLEPKEREPPPRAPRAPVSGSALPPVVPRAQPQPPSYSPPPAPSKPVAAKPPTKQPTSTKIPYYGE